MSDDVQEQLDRLVSTVEQQQEIIEEQRERITALEAESRTGGAETTDNPALVDRRDVLKAGGLLALLFGGVGTASADAQGQVGTSSDPLETLYTAALDGPITDDGNGSQRISNLLGDGLRVDQEDLAVTTGDGLSVDEGQLAVATGNGLGVDGSGHLEYDPPENVLVVAKGGGDYTTVSSALESIDDNAADNPYLVWIAPGVYEEEIQLKSHVDIVGAGWHATRIESNNSHIQEATVQGNGASNVEVRRLTLQGGVTALFTEDENTDVAFKQVRLRTDSDDAVTVFLEGGPIQFQNCRVEETGSNGVGIEVGDNQKGDGVQVDVIGSYVEGDELAIYQWDNPVAVRHSQLVGGTDNSEHTFFSVCDKDYNEIE